MKKTREMCRKCAAIAVPLLAAAYCLIRPMAAGRAAADALERCIYTVIPSLYAMLAAAPLLIRSGTASRLPTRLAGSVFGMTGSEFAVFLISMAAGYPVGAKMLSQGEPSRRNDIFAGICFGAGPPFIFGCISGNIFGGAAAGRLVLVSNAAANVILALILSPLLRRDKKGRDEREKPPLTISGKMLTECVMGAGDAAIGICCAVMAFSVVISALGDIGAIGAAARLLSAVGGIGYGEAEILCRATLDVTALSELPHGCYGLLPWISALVSLGGMCVFFQISAAVTGRVRLVYFLPLRAAAAVLSFMVCRMLMPLMLGGEAVAAAAVSVRAFRSASPVPSILLLVMTLIVAASDGGGELKKCPKRSERGAV